MAIQLGIPTANIPPSGLSAYPSLESGVYYGFVGLRLHPRTMQAADNSKLTLSSSDPPANGASQPEREETHVYPAVLSIGYNPFYANKTRSIEIHVLHHFARFNFYHSPLNLLMVGFIRPEYDYESLEALVDDIKTDCNVARKSLERKAYRKYEDDAWLQQFDWVNEVDTQAVEEEVVGDGEKKEEP
jgi:riboflavin kinase